MLSIFLLLIEITLYFKPFFLIKFLKNSLSFGFKIFESKKKILFFSKIFKVFLSKYKAPKVNGPAKAPLPASSIATKFLCFFINFFSIFHKLDFILLLDKIFLK